MTARKKHWSKRNFVTEVLLPSLFTRRNGRAQKPVFPTPGPKEFAITWIGHASFLIQTHKHNLLIDPNWANWLLAVKRQRHAGIKIHDLPNIDLVLITHAHFDHLNRRSLRSIAAHQPILVPSGVGSLVADLGFEFIREMEWWNLWKHDGLEITFTPAKHWGARVLADSHRGYGGYVIRYNGRSVYHVGDSAYFDGFKKIGSKLKPEIVLMPIGSYDPPSGRDVHINPEQAVKAFKELKAKTMVPMHFGTYQMSYEPMHEPLGRLFACAAKQGVLPNINMLVEGLPEIF